MKKYRPYGLHCPKCHKAFHLYNIEIDEYAPPSLLQQELTDWEDGDRACSHCRQVSYYKLSDVIFTDLK